MNRASRTGWRPKLIRTLAAASLGVIAALAPAAAAEAPIKVVGSTFVSPFLRSVFDRLVEARIIVPPQQDYQGTVRGLAEFCRSVSPDTASVVAMSRRMRTSEFEACQGHGVADIIEIQLGSNTLVLAARRNDADYELTLRNLYDAVAREVPKDDEFITNPHKRWKDVDDQLPDLPIRVMVPAEGLGSRGFFEDRFLEAACRGISQIRTIFSAESRVRQCIALRRDNVLTEVGTPYDQALRQAMTDAQPGSIAVVPFNMATSMNDILKVLPLDGVLPSPTTVASRTYPFNRPLYVYVKKAHVKDYRGRGPVAGLPNSSPN